MNFLNLAKERYSVRKFSDRNVEQEKLDLILEAGRVAPTAENKQPQRILVLNTENGLAKLRDCTPFHYDSHLVLLVCYDNTVSWKRSIDQKDMGEIDAAIVATHMMLEAASVGVGCTWIGYFDFQKITEAYNLPKNILPVVLLPMGYPEESSNAHPYHFKRADIEKTVFYF
ncbi:MAG TPA: nitroreductase family protein [Bacillota bacterium]|nr:nitroreductase family protein [Bacillota bacterium]